MVVSKSTVAAMATRQRAVNRMAIFLEEVACCAQPALIHGGATPDEAIKPRQSSLPRKKKAGTYYAPRERACLAAE